jgi:tetratricopeptide (TPR) repeat protein
MMDKQVQRFYQKGLAANARGNWLLALQHFRKCLEMDESCAQAYYEIGMLYYKRGQHDEALEFMQQAVEHNTGNVQINFALANIFLTSDQPERAIELYHNIENSDEEPTPALLSESGHCLRRAWQQREGHRLSGGIAAPGPAQR